MIRASAGQQLRITKTGAPIVYFNLLPPGSSDEAIFIGSRDGDSFAGTLPATGAYRIRVYQMRASARRAERGAFTLAIAITGKAAATGDSLADRCKAAILKEGAKVSGVIRQETIPSGTRVYLSVVGGQAPWLCIADKAGRVIRVEYSGSEGRL